MEGNDKTDEEKIAELKREINSIKVRQRELMEAFNQIRQEVNVLENKVERRT